MVVVSQRGKQQFLQDDKEPMPIPMPYQLEINVTGVVNQGIGLTHVIAGHCEFDKASGRGG